MALDDREQQILAEIERHLYADDPDLARSVRNIDRTGRFGVRLPTFALACGFALLIATFTVNSTVAAIGFAVMTVSATALIHGIRSRGGVSSSDEDGSDGGRQGPFDRLRRRP